GRLQGAMVGQGLAEPALPREGWVKQTLARSGGEVHSVGRRSAVLHALAHLDLPCSTSPRTDEPSVDDGPLEPDPGLLGEPIWQDGYQPSSRDSLRRSTA